MPVAPVEATRGNLTRSRIFYVQNSCDISRLLLVLSQHDSEGSMHHHSQHLTLVNEDPVWWKNSVKRPFSPERSP